MYELKSSDSFMLRFGKSVKEYWSAPALTDFGDKTYTYKDLASEIETLILTWKATGLKPGDKIAINAKSSAAWAEVYFATQIGGYIAVPLFPGFTPSDTTSLLEHSDSRLLYTEKAFFEKMDFNVLPNLLGAVDTKSGEVLASRGDFSKIYSERFERFEKEHPTGLTPGDINYQEKELDEVITIMYTSGSTGNPKGVMITNRNISSNVRYFEHDSGLPFIGGENYVSILPYAHIFGLVVDLITSLSCGMHLVVLGLPPIPQFVKPALRKYAPQQFFVVPLVMIKLLEDTVGEFIHSKSGIAKLNDYKNNPDFCEALRIIITKALGGRIKVFATGGAAIPSKLEHLLVEQLGLPFITGYGMTEATPPISVGRVGKYKLKECGECADELVEVKIDSPQPSIIPGEILVRGHIIFAGYYKNEAATRAVLEPDGWFHTGDLGTMDSDGSLFIAGRSKSMILSDNGQNIFPEEIEVKLNELPYVAESLIVSRGGHLVALIVPDANRAAELDAVAMKNVMDANISELDRNLPSYSQISTYELHYDAFAKTPKGSIRRFMYE